MSRFNQVIDVLGKLFQLQTKLTDQVKGAVRTEVVLDGKVVATREARVVKPGEGDDEAVDARVQDQHKRVLEMFVDRVERYQQRDQAQPGPTALPTMDVSAPRVAPVESPAAPPSPTATPSLATSIRIRNLFGRFCKLIGSPSMLLPSDVDVRLERAATTFGQMIASSLFAEIRLDEQVRCHLLKEQIDEWLANDREPEEAARIWSGIMTFNNYLAEINHRSELAAFDRQLLAWAVKEVESHGMTRDVREHLSSLYGLMPQLNLLLDKPREVADATWIAHLRSGLRLSDPCSTDRFEALTLPLER